MWAPNAQRVDLLIGDATLPLKPSRDGSFVIDADAVHGTDYSFVLDAGSPLPDPRSEWQSNGVHGPSRIVDHGAFAWSDDDWNGVDLDDQVIYELHIGTFTPAGTCDAAIDRLDHLTTLGVTAVELLPVAEFAGARGWGYDGVDLFAPHHAYGGPDGLKRLVDACHARGLAVILDVVYNHLGPDGNYLGRFGPYFTARYATPWGEAVNLDGPGSGAVRRFFIDNALYWLREYHFDGLRLDAVHAILDQSAVHLLEEMSAEVARLSHELRRRLFLIAESDLNDPRVVWPRRVGGYGIDAQWSDDFHHSLHSVLAGETNGYYADFGTLQHLAQALRNAFVYEGHYSSYRARPHGRPARLPTDEWISRRRFLAYLQNHDQIGNRAQGERSSELVSRSLLKVGAAVVMMSPFVPMLFQGEEWGATTPFLYFTDHQDPELGRAVSEGRKREFSAFGWAPDEVPDPQDPKTFERSVLDWTELQDPVHAEVLEWHRGLIALRRARRELVDPTEIETQVAFNERDRWMVVERGALFMVCNFGPTAVELDTEPPDELLLSTEEPARRAGGMIVPPDSASIYSK